MADVSWLLRLVIFGVTVRGPLAASRKEVIDHIKCGVCKHAVKEAAHRAKEKDINDEDELIDLVDNMCVGSKDEGKWTSKIDIMRRWGQSGAELYLDYRDEEGECQKECQTIQSACTAAMKGSREQELVSMLKERAGIGTLQREVCKKPCAKSAGKLGEWTDEVWKPVKPKMPPAPEPPPPPPADPVDAFAPVMPDVVASALTEFGATASPDQVKTCFTGSVADDASKYYLEEIKKAAEDMLEKKLEKMRTGLGRLGKAFSGLAETVETLCNEIVGKSAAHPTVSITASMKNLGQYLAVYSTIRDASGIEYEPMKALKVHGYDIHKLLNALLGAWKQDPADGINLGQALAKLFKALEDPELLKKAVEKNPPVEL